MTTRLTLVCHAATPATRASAFPADEALDPRWLPRLASLAGSLGRVDQAWTSPALRARQTAEGLGLVATSESLLRDCDYGRWTGRSFNDVEAQEPELLAEWLRDPAAAPHGGESIIDLIRRVAVWLDQQELKARTGGCGHACRNHQSRHHPRDRCDAARVLEDRRDAPVGSAAQWSAGPMDAVIPQPVEGAARLSVAGRQR